MKKKHLLSFLFLILFSGKTFSHGRGGQYEHEIVYNAKKMVEDQRWALYLLLIHMKSDHPEFANVLKKAALVNALDRVDGEGKTVLHHIASQSDTEEAQRKIERIVRVQEELPQDNFLLFDIEAENDRDQTALAVALQYHPHAATLHKILSNCKNLDSSCKMHRQAVEVNQGRKSL